MSTFILPITTALDDLLAWYETLTPTSVKDVRCFYQSDAVFKDPFNEVKGIAAIQAIFAHMFATTDNPRFIIHDRIVQGQQAFVTWTFEFALNHKPYTIQGGSHLKFNEEGLLIEHRDYWDAAEELLQKLPIVGLPIRWLRKQFLIRK